MGKRSLNYSMNGPICRGCGGIECCVHGERSPGANVCGGASDSGSSLEGCGLSSLVCVCVSVGSGSVSAWRSSLGGVCGSARSGSVSVWLWLSPSGGDSFCSGSSVPGAFCVVSDGACVKSSCLDWGVACFEARFSFSSGCEGFGVLFACVSNSDFIWRVASSGDREFSMAEFILAHLGFA